MRTFKPDQIIIEYTARAWDLAVTPKTDADNSVGSLVSLGSVRLGDELSGGWLFIRDQIVMQQTYPVVREEIYNTAVRDGPDTVICIPIQGQQKGFYQDLCTDIRFEPYCLVSISESSQKLTRAIRWINRAYAGRIVLVDNVSRWVEPFLIESSRFTGHDDPKDDRIDSISIAYEHLWSMISDDLEKKELDKDGEKADDSQSDSRDGPPRRSFRSLRRQRTTFL